MTSITPLSSPVTDSIVFPSPPPTSNNLTFEQRAQLRKSTSKLRRLLGTTPHLLDTDVVSVLGKLSLCYLFHCSLDTRLTGHSFYLPIQDQYTYKSHRRGRLFHLFFPNLLLTRTLQGPLRVTHLILLILTLHVRRLSRNPLHRCLFHAQDKTYTSGSQVLQVVW